MSGRRTSPRRPGFALLAVLVVMGGILLVTTTLLFVTRSHVAGGAMVRDRVQARALAWSGLQAVMSRLDEHRGEILEGRLPSLDERYEVYEDGGLLGVVRLLPAGPDGARLVAESGRIDLNRADARMLEATGLLERSLAEAIVAHRESAGGGRYQSVGDLLEVQGITPQVLWGPIEDLAAPDEDTGGRGAGPGGGPVRGRSLDSRPRGLADLTTVFAHEPALQRNGRLRINLNVPWSEDLARRVAERFGRESSDVLRQIFEGGTTFDTEAKLFQALRFFQVPPADWPEIIDAFTTDEGEYHFGRLNINEAPHEALAALPGLAPEQAAEIVRVRENLPAEERATVAWPAIRGIVRPEQYDDLAGWITTRSWTYRLRLEAGLEDPKRSDAPLESPVVYEAVVDLAGPRPRVAWLRDVTLLATAAAIAAAAEPEDDEGEVEAGHAAAADDGEAADGEAGADDAGDAADEAGEEPEGGSVGGTGPEQDEDDPPAAGDEAPVGDPVDPASSGRGPPASGGAPGEPRRTSSTPRRIGRWLGG